MAGPGSGELARALAAAGTDVLAYPDLTALDQAVADGAPLPATVLAAAGAAGAAGGSGDAGQDSAGSTGAAQDAVVLVLGLMQQWLATERLAGARLVIVTRGAVSAGPGEGVPDLPGRPGLGPGPVGAGGEPGAGGAGRPRPRR